mmetsp:Transcript_57764/g.135589  ORF Transcript_57764/g.135589 Transcript_57764/m.135589 type:complete len:596 (+) Transcript_57764:37-1824(+)
MDDGVEDVATSPLVPKLPRPLSARSAWVRRKSQEQPAARPFSREKVVKLGDDVRPMTEGGHERRRGISDVPGARDAWQDSPEGTAAVRPWSRDTLVDIVGSQSQGPARLFREVTEGATRSGGWSEQLPSGDDDVGATDTTGEVIWAVPVFRERESAGSTLPSARGSNLGSWLEPNQSSMEPNQSSLPYPRLPGRVLTDADEEAVLVLPEDENQVLTTESAESHVPESRWENLGRKTGLGFFFDIPSQSRGDAAGGLATGRESVQDRHGAGNTVAMLTTRSEQHAPPPSNTEVLAVAASDTEDELRPHHRPKAARGRRPVSAINAPRAPSAAWSARPWSAGSNRVYACPGPTDAAIGPAASRVLEDEPFGGVLGTFLRTTGIEDWLRGAAEYLDAPPPSERQGSVQALRLSEEEEEDGASVAQSTSMSSVRTVDRLDRANVAIAREKVKARALFRGVLLILGLAMALMLAICAMTYYIVDLSKDLRLSSDHFLTSRFHTVLFICPFFFSFLSPSLLLSFLLLLCSSPFLLLFILFLLFLLLRPFFHPLTSPISMLSPVLYVSDALLQRQRGCPRQGQVGRSALLLFDTFLCLDVVV